MSSALQKLHASHADRLGLGPHAARLFQELQLAARHNLWATTIILSATIIDVLRHEDVMFDLEESDDGLSYGEIDAGGYDYLPYADRKKLNEIRKLRNSLVHYEGAVEGMMGQKTDDGYLRQQADKAASLLMMILEDL